LLAIISKLGGGLTLAFYGWALINKKARPILDLTEVPLDHQVFCSSQTKHFFCLFPVKEWKREYTLWYTMVFHCFIPSERILKWFQTLNPCM
jgi:hypothetical protein